LLATLRLPLLVSVHLAPEDPRYADLQRNVLAKLDRAMPNVSISLAGGRQGFSTEGDESYGEIEYVYGGRSDVSRSTSPREILPLIYSLAGVGAILDAAHVEGGHHDDARGGRGLDHQGEQMHPALLGLVNVGDQHFY